MKSNIINRYYKKIKMKALKGTGVFLFLIICLISTDVNFTLTSKIIADMDHSLGFKLLSLYTGLIIPFIFYFIFYLCTVLNKYNVIKLLCENVNRELIIHEIEKQYANGQVLYECIMNPSDYESSIFVTNSYLVFFEVASATFNKIYIIPLRQVKEIIFEEMDYSTIRSRYSMQTKRLYRFYFRTNRNEVDVLNEIYVAMYVKESAVGLLRCLQNDCKLLVKNYEQLS